MERRGFVGEVDRGSDGVVSWFVVVGLGLIWLVRVELR